MLFPILITTFILSEDFLSPSQAHNADAGLVLKRSPHNLTSNSPTSASFVTSTIVTCKSDSLQLQCPPRMYIQPIAVNAQNEIPSSPSLPGTISPNCIWSESERNTYSQFYRQYSFKCLRTDAHIRIKQSCQGRQSCKLFGSELQHNLTDCTKHNFPIRIDYQCLPDPNTALFEAVCADTYMEVKCDGRSLAVAVLSARLEPKIDLITDKLRPGCPMLPGDGTNSNCQIQPDVTESLQLACNGQPSCSISPNSFGGSVKQAGTCRKMHLSIAYVCVPSDLIVISRQSLPPTDSAKRNKSQRLPKDALPAKVLENTVVSEPERHIRNEYKNVPTEPTEYEHATTHDLPQQLEMEQSSLNSNPKPSPKVINAGLERGILQPLFIGLGVGAGILLLGLICLVALCQYNRNPTNRKLHLHRDPKEQRRSQTERTCSSSCSSMWQKNSMGCVRDSAWSGLPRQCHTCSIQEEPRTPSSLISYNETGPRSDAPVGLMHESYLHHHRYPCCNPSSTSNLVPLPLPTNGTPLTADGFQLNVPDIQYMMGIRTDDTPTEATNPFILDQHSINQSNRSSSGVCMNVKNNGYEPPFPMNLNSVASMDMQNNRFDASVYSGALAWKCSSIGGSSSGRGCDGGSGASEASEAIQSNRTTSKLLYPGPNPGISNTTDYSSRVYGNVFAEAQEFSLTTSPVNSSTCYPVTNSIYPTDHSRYLSNSSVPESHFGQSITSIPPSLSSASKQRFNMAHRPSFRAALDTTYTLASTLVKNKRSLETDLEKTTSCLTYNGQDYRKQSLDGGTGKCLTRNQSQRSQYSPIPDIAERAMTPTGDGGHSGSMESVTEPLLEPPSNFRTTPVKHSTSMECTSKVERDQSSDNETFMNEPPDLLLKTRIVSNLKRSDETELPPPPIAPLSVLLTPNNKFSLTTNSRFCTLR